MDRDSSVKDDCNPMSSEWLDGYVEGLSPSVQALERIIQELAHSDVPVLMLGEAGSGKRTAAQRIHCRSPRRDEPFRVAPTARIAPEAFELKDQESLLSGGTLFLEEVEELTLACQARLFHNLSSPEAGNGHRRSQARLICASAADLEREVRSGRFREDLYYRISGVCLRLPPLRQRKDDIPSLLNFFLQKYAGEFRRSIPVVSAETLKLFQEYAWPGNIRELEDVAKVIVAVGDEQVAMGGLRAQLIRPDRFAKGERVSLKQAARAASREAEKELILKALAKTRWNRRRAAEELQISYKALLYKLKQIGYSEVL